jgi:hypothetical protein
MATSGLAVLLTQIWVVSNSMCNAPHPRKNGPAMALWAVRMAVPPGGLGESWRRRALQPFDAPKMRLTLYFVFGGLGAGSITAAYCLSLAGGISTGDLIFPYLTGGAILALGLAWVWAPLDPRLRSVDLLIRPTPSWIAYETYAAVAFFLALATVAKVAAPTVELLVVLTALTFLICQANVANASKSRAAWRAPQIPSLIVMTSLATGVGMIALLSALISPIIRGSIFAPVIGLVLAGTGALRWREYVRALASAHKQNLRTISMQLYLITYAVPSAFYLAALLPWPGNDWMLPAGGVAAIVGGAVWMYVVIARFGRSRTFTASPIGL